MKMLRPVIRTRDSRAVRPPAKEVDEHYRSAGHQAWRRIVLERAGFRCEAIEAGKRCDKAAPAHTLFADHIRERRDGGASLDPKNGQCLCGRHHTLKTLEVRARRMQTPGGVVKNF